MTQLIDCPKCEGSGKMELPEHLKTTLSCFKGAESIIADDLHRKFPRITVNAINNRLLELHTLGFLLRKRMGKFWLYSRASETKKPKGKK